MSTTTGMSHSVRPTSWPWGMRDHPAASWNTVSRVPPPSRPFEIDKHDDNWSEKHERRQTLVKDDEAPSTFSHGHQKEELWTRDLCVVGLILGWGAALASLATGIYIVAAGPTTTPSFLSYRVASVGPISVRFTKTTSLYMNDHRVYQVSEAAMVILPLLLQIALTFVSACLDSIHSTTLRWALLREGRSSHNTNLRLFTASGSSGPNGWPANVASSFGLVLAYAGTVLMSYPVKVVAIYTKGAKNPHNYDADLGPNRFGIDFNGWGVMGLGIGLLIQSSICTWCMARDASQRGVGTWNSNPLATARACRRMGLFRDANTKPLTPESDSSRPHYAEPLYRQPSMRSLIPATRTITNWIWVVAAIYGTLAIVVLVLAARVQHTASIGFVKAEFTPSSTPGFPQVWMYFGQIRYKYAWMWKDHAEWGGLFIQCLAVSPFLFGLHLGELLGGLARDESIWRSATTERGASPESNLLLENLKSWPNVVVFVAKALIPWVFSYGLACNTLVVMAFFPIVTVLVMFVVIGAFAEYLIRAAPKGSQPSAFGDVQALVALVDEESWDHDRMFWGDKGEYEHVRGVRVAGTAEGKLDPLHMDALYVGLAR